VEHEDNIEYAKGGRISPEQSATIPPLGTLGIGNNEDVWITENDKNGRKSWKPTEIKKDKFYIIKWNAFVDAESIDFDIKFPNFKWKLRYLYNQPSYCELRFTSDYNKELEGSLTDLKVFFITQFSVDKFNETRGDIIWSGFDVYQEVINIINILEKLQTTGKLRQPKNDNPDFEEEVTLANFSIGDIVLLKDGNTEFRVVQNKWNGKTWVCEVKDINTSAPFSFKQELLELSVPRTPFQKIDFLSPSSEELDTVIKTIQMNSDKVTFINGTLAGVNVKLNDRTLFVDVLFDQVNDLIKLYADGLKCFSNEIQPKITNESLQEISEIYYKTLVRLLKKVELDKTEPDCQADPSLIVSGQVKKFYDLNRPRIEKLKSEFSCKIIKALVSLSEYEKCGTPNKGKLPQKNEDLLSKINKLKF